MEDFLDINLKSTAIAILFHTKWNSRKANKTNDFVVKEILAQFVSSLEDDDLGYFYDPQKPYELCTNPGELVGKIANSHLPYNFDFSKGIECLKKMLESISDDYNRIGIIVSDSSLEDHHFLISTIKNAQIHVFSIKDGVELEDKLREIHTYN